MRIQIITIIGILVLINLVGAIDVFSGDSYSFESEQFDYYDVIGNSSSLEGMNISWDEGNTTISFDYRFKSDSFTLIFWKDNELIVEVYSGGGGGGTRTIYKDKNNTIYKDKIIRIPEYINQTIPYDEIPPEKPDKIKTILLFIGIIILILGVIWYIVSKRKNG